MQLLAICIMALVFGFVGSMPLAGPIAILAVSRATQQRFGEALRVGLGAAAAEGIYAGLAFFGFSTFLADHAVVVPISHGMTALVLVAVGLRFVFWKASDGPERARDENKAGTVLFGFTVSALNPTLILTWSAAVAFLYSRGLHEPSPAYAVPFGLCAAAGVAAWFVVLVLLLRRYHGHLPSGVLTWVVRAMGLVLVVLGLLSGAKLVRFIEDPKGYAGDSGNPARRGLAHR
jgi:threonine/homoserine/homoserine lactone efflux protein